MKDEGRLTKLDGPGSNHEWIEARLAEVGIGRQVKVVRNGAALCAAWVSYFSAERPPPDASSYPSRLLSLP
jgi:hypothetical protein